MRKLAKLGLWCLSGVVVSWLLVNAVPAGGAISPTDSLPTELTTPHLGDRAIAQNRTRLGIPQDLDPATLPDFPSRDLQGNSRDPADQIAPPGLLVRPGDAPISYFFGIRMEQELDSLVGRYESALFAANAATQPIEVRLPEESESIASTDNKTRVASTELAAVSTPALETARQLKQDWPDLLATEAYGEARRRWLDVRDALWAGFPLDRPFAQAEIRAMWLDRGSIVRAGSRAGLARLFDNMQTAGINTVFLETMNAGFPIYPSRVAPQQNPLTQGWDPLADAVELAHARNMDLHAWIWIFAAGNLRHNAILAKSDQFLGPSLAANPDWVGYDQAGSPIPLGQTKPFYDPANPELRDYLLRLEAEIITNYDVDGLQLDYIRYPFQDPSAERTYGYGDAARRAFQQQTGVDPTNLTPLVDPWLPREERDRLNDLWQAWNDFRIEQVTSFVAETSELVRRERPDITLSVAVFAMSEEERLLKIQQDWNTWAEQGLVDWIVLMSYAQDANRFSELITPWVVDQSYDSTLVIPGLRLLSMPLPVMIDQLQTLRDMPATGYALFATDNLDDRIRSMLNTTQGQHQSLIPQQTPYATAAARYRALQQEWNWLLVNGLITLQPRLAERWVTEVNAVGASLDALANDPGGSVAAVQAQVTELQRTIGAGVTLSTTTTPEYRLNTWKNRLEAINRFLAYGAQP
ncbi:glycoside hydrolase family 10 protein [Halomicronema sp. CCY15110]|uniref:glycoside hydrolase family 10 protein n=1 Tax=Halomicronema sp. CCY15110 TaxID=2767773 RepID=UPI0019511CF8|nr:family 10 glycosylhydrolase [Halomicronema sp. CCY15110]